MIDIETARIAFERWFSDGGMWPNAVRRNGDSYRLMQASAAWTTWKAAVEWAASEATRERSVK